MVLLTINLYYTLVLISIESHMPCVQNNSFDNKIRRNDNGIDVAQVPILINEITYAFVTYEYFPLDVLYILAAFIIIKLRQYHTTTLSKMMALFGI